MQGSLWLALKRGLISAMIPGQEFHPTLMAMPTFLSAQFKAELFKPSRTRAGGLSHLIINLISSIQYLYFLHKLSESNCPRECLAEYFHCIDLKMI
jgi:hypothetical protein